MDLLDDRIEQLHPVGFPLLIEKRLRSLRHAPTDNHSYP
jgi:hypothetical protein